MKRRRERESERGREKINVRERMRDGEIFEIFSKNINIKREIKITEMGNRYILSIFHLYFNMYKLI
jgi:hypothetical protein